MTLRPWKSTIFFGPTQPPPERFNNSALDKETDALQTSDYDTAHGRTQYSTFVTINSIVMPNC